MEMEIRTPVSRAERYIRMDGNSDPAPQIPSRSRSFHHVATRPSPSSLHSNPFHAFSISLTSHTQARYSNRETPNGNAQDLVLASVLWNVDGIVHVFGDGTR